jgi:hypothetical protein
MVKDEKDSVIDSLVKRLQNLDDTKGRKCEGCGCESDDIEFFNCEFCGGPICTLCYNMTNDCSFICRSCIQMRGLTIDDVQFSEDGAGRSFF